MASTADVNLFNNRRLDQFPINEGSVSHRPSPIDYRPGREHWDLRNNIWQTSRFPEYITSDDRQRALSTRDSKLTTTDVSKTVARAPVNGDHNIPTSIATSLLPFGLEPTAFSNRPLNSLVSPTKLRGNGISGTETSTMVTDVARSRLLSGSSPDIDPLKQPSSSQTAFTSHSGSTIGRSFRCFNVEDAEEFVPSYLQRRSDYANRVIKPDRDDYTYPYDRLTEASTFEPSFGLDQTVSRQRTKETQQTSSNTLRGAVTHPQIYLQQHSWPVMQNEREISVDSKLRAHHRHSGLRADVPSYRPSDTGLSTVPHTHQRTGTGYGYHTGFSRAPEIMYSGPSSINQQAVYANSNIYGTNSMARPNAFHTYRNESQQSQQTMTQPSTSRYEVDGSGIRQYGIPSHPASRHGTFYETGPRVSHEGTMQQTYPISSTNTFPVDQYEYLNEPPQSATYYHQMRSHEVVNNTSNNYSDGAYPPEDETKVERRSELLEEFRVHQKSRKYELKDIYGYVVEFSGDQSGSRFIQTKLEQANSDEKDQVFAELQTNARQLMSDVFGNYVIQKMFEYGNQSQKKALAGYMQGYVLKLSLQPYGCRCVQKAFEHILVEQQALLIKELEGHVIAVVESQHGNHVIQKAIECLQAADIQFIVDAHKNQVVRLARHTYGCRIVQRMLEYCVPHAKRAILDELQPAIPLLIEDQFGNYVIQCIIMKCGAMDRYKVIEHVQRRVLRYSTHKFASNVVEVAIQFAEEGQRVAMVRTLTGPEPSMGMQTPVMSLLKDQYGNYVMQTVLRTIQGPAKRALAEEVSRYVECVSKDNRGRQVLAMQETLNAISAGHSPSSISTGPQTPRTPTSLHSGGSVGTPVTKGVEIDPSGYAMRDSHRGVISFGQFQG